jgi:hypothetical protein
MFTKQLKALKTTMSGVKSETFDMMDWHCGTVACICGHQGISGDLTEFPTALLAASPGFIYSSGEIGVRASSVANDLDDACEVMFGTDRLARSVWQGFGRLSAAIDSGMLTPKQLTHRHLNTDSSPADVADYIDMLLGVIDVHKTT